MVSGGRIEVVLHGVEPATFEKCALIRDWLADHGIDRLTLVVLPPGSGHDLHPRAAALEAWLRERLQAGDAIVEHRCRRTSRPARATLRLDLHPAAFERPQDVYAMERVLSGAHDRVAVTAEELLAG